MSETCHITVLNTHSRCGSVVEELRRTENQASNDTGYYPLCFVIRAVVLSDTFDDNTATVVVDISPCVENTRQLLL
jgi:hypothetical protein